MFTGLVEAVGELVESKPTSRGTRLRIAAALAAELAPGDSLAVNGVCLTVTFASESELLAAGLVVTSCRGTWTRSGFSKRCALRRSSAG